MLPRSTWPKVCAGSVGRRLIRIHITSIGAPRSITSRPARSRTTEWRPSAPIVNGARISSAVRSLCAHSGHDAVLFQEIGHLGLHLQVKRGVAACLLLNKVEEIPLRHQRQEAAVSRQMSEIREGDRFAADLAGKLSHFLMRAFQELIQNAEFIHDIERGWMDRVAAEIAQEVRVLFEHENVHALARQKKAQHHAGGTASRNATASVDRVIHTHQS